MRRGWLGDRQGRGRGKGGRGQAKREGKVVRLGKLRSQGRGTQTPLPFCIYVYICNYRPMLMRALPCFRPPPFAVVSLIRDQWLTLNVCRQCRSVCGICRFIRLWIAFYLFVFTAKNVGYFSAAKDVSRKGFNEFHQCYRPTILRAKVALQFDVNIRYNHKNVLNKLIDRLVHRVSQWYVGSMWVRQLGQVTCRFRG